MNEERGVAGVLAIVMLGWSSVACRSAVAERHEPVVEKTASADGPRGATLLSAAAELASRVSAARLSAEDAVLPPDARLETCGSMSRLLESGSGPQRPSDDDRVLLEYTMFNRSGQALDSSATHGEPVAESVRNLAPGLPCVVKRMRVGESRRVWLPAATKGATEEGPRSVPAAELIVDVTLRELTRAPQRPVHYAAPPPGARRTATGLRFQVLHRGSGDQQPAANSRVTIYHSGWTSRGVLFASSVLAGEPASFLTYELPIGLSEGVQLMRVGDKLRFWLPERLAYATAPRNAPKGPVVFDVELLAID
ncbi:MAG TPA: FKBP-type peptidyl-prolyl cis-trans isomerase [Polyangiaceae bacterium]|nr:FKBP-type peptidyl-prolyl cis-trans isomerase [Polyangiaceae bacterium]